MKKKLLSVFLCAAMVACLAAGCGSSSSEEGEKGESEKSTESTESTESEEKKVIKLGVRADGIEMAESIRESVKEAGYELEVTTFDDSIQPNVALGEGSIDVNWFQHQPYLDSYNAENGTDFVMAQPYTHYPLFAMYSDKHETLEDIPEGGKIGVCNDATNQVRGLTMLQDLGLITLDESVETPTIYDIKENPKNLEFIEAEMSVLPQSLKDVDAIVLAGHHMFNAGLDATDFVEESADGPDYSLGFVTRKEDKDAQWVKDLVDAACCDSLKEYFESTGGTLIPAF